jgi:hypothetical protein
MRRRLCAVALALIALTASGCIYVSTPPQRTVVRETRYIPPPPRTVVRETRYIGPPRETVVTSLPPSYRVRVYRGRTYYVYNNVYYRAHPRGYVVVERPW